MKIKTTIQSNQDLYGDFKLTPLNTDAVDQRIDFFNSEIEKALVSSSDELNKFIKARDFWREIKDKHCVKVTV